MEKVVPIAECASPVAEAAQALDRLPAQACGVIESLEERNGDLDRLKELGLCVGRRIEVLHRGDPMIVRIFGSRLGLSARLAARIRVRCCLGDTCATSGQP
jgi:Fe2+ transport system protein FeoA